MEEEGVESTTVLIPLISGQPIGQMLSLSYLQETGLNPFDIRATDRTNPAEAQFRASGLNPFDIRATDRTAIDAWHDETPGS